MGWEEFNVLTAQVFQDFRSLNASVSYQKLHCSFAGFVYTTRAVKAPVLPFDKIGTIEGCFK